VDKVKVAILGATGFTGEKLVEILLKHSKAQAVYLASRILESAPYAQIFTHFSGKTNLNCEPLDIEKAAQISDILFYLCLTRFLWNLPHTCLKRAKK